MKKINPERDGLTFDEIKNGDEFEELVARYFALQESREPSVDVPPSIGPDGGRDIQVTLRLAGPVDYHVIKWVVQCKFHNKNIGLPAIATINIPTLIHEHRADGYLLICKKGVSSELQKKFENLQKNCKFGYKYAIWTGNTFIGNILDTNEVILEQYFPQYYKYKKTHL